MDDYCNEHLRQVYQGNRWENLDVLLSDEVFRQIDNVMKDYEVTVLNPFRENKKLLVLDIDCTLVYGDGSCRLYLHEMLARIYRNYDIVLWSADDSDSILKRIQALGLLDTDDYKFAFFLDKDAMVPVVTANEEILVKPLCVIWRKFPEYSAKNTITFDDYWRNYALNKISGISTPRNSEFEDKNHDRTLLKVSEYLKTISRTENFEKLNHTEWMKSLEKFKIQYPFQARIVGDNITMDILSSESTVNFALFPSCATLKLPSNLPVNKDGYRTQRYKLETQLPIRKNQRDPSEILGDVENPCEYVKRLEQKITSLDIELLNPLRNGKKLLVLDFDYTLCDPEVDDFPCLESKRPYLIEFLSRVYQHYDIAIWGAKSREWMTKALENLKILTNKNYKIAFYLTAEAMVSVKSKKSGPLEVKPLDIIWRKFDRYGVENTIAVDDIEGNFMMHPEARLEVKPYTYSDESTDLELRKLARYLETISLVSDFSRLNHENWRCLETMSKLSETQDVEAFDDSYEVIIQWPSNKLIIMNVHEDITVDNIRKFFSEATGYAVQNQNLVIHRLNPCIIKIQPYIDKKMIIFHNPKPKTSIIDQLGGSGDSRKSYSRDDDHNKSKYRRREYNNDNNNSNNNNGSNNNKNSSSSYRGSRSYRDSPYRHRSKNGGDRHNHHQGKRRDSNASRSHSNSGYQRQNFSERRSNDNYLHQQDHPTTATVPWNTSPEPPTHSRAFCLAREPSSIASDQMEVVEIVQLGSSGVTPGRRRQLPPEVIIE